MWTTVTTIPCVYVCVRESVSVWESEADRAAAPSRVCTPPPPCKPRTLVCSPWLLRPFYRPEWAAPWREQSKASSSYTASAQPHSHGRTDSTFFLWVSGFCGCGGGGVEWGVVVLTVLLVLLYCDELRHCRLYWQWMVFFFVCLNISRELMNMCFEIHTTNITTGVFFFFVEVWNCVYTVVAQYNEKLLYWPMY